MKRYVFVALNLLVVLSFIISGCATKETIKTVEVEKIVTQEVEKIVEKEVEKIVTQEVDLRERAPSSQTKESHEPPPA